ncbi:cellulose biosynthesis protein BcsG, partial [Burkholderia contaminans]
MTFWNLYFILKFALFATGHLQPFWLANLAFAVALAASAPIRRRAWRIVRPVVAIAIAVPLPPRALPSPPPPRPAPSPRTAVPVPPHTPEGPLPPLPPPPTPTPPPPPPRLPSHPPL